MNFGFGNVHLGSTMRGLRKLSGKRIRHLPIMVAISMLAFLFEGLAIYMMFPLIEILVDKDGANTQSGLLNWISESVARLPDGQQVAVVVSIIVACILIKSVIAFFSTVVFSNGAQRIGDDIRRKSFSQVLAASPLFHSSRPAGATLNTLTNQNAVVSHGLEEVAKMIMSASAVVVFIALLLTISWRATLAILLGVLIPVGAAYLINRHIRRIGRTAVKAREDMTVRTVEGLNGHTTLRLFNASEQAKSAFDASSDRTRRTYHRLYVVSAIPQLLLDVLFAVVIGVVLVLLNKENVSEILVLIALILRMQPYAVSLVHTRAILASIAGGIENLEDLYDGAFSTSESLGLPDAPVLKNVLSLSDVGFSYPRSNDDLEHDLKPALVDVNFEIPAGKVTALVGHSGAGKSTLAMLLCCLADAESGRILVDGANLAEYDASSWRDRCAFVPQDVFLFNQSIRENILLGRPDASDTEIERAATEANAHDFINELPNGYETSVGDRGENLSGGQRQRIALARALLRQPDLLILDEATNALDPRSERLVSDALSINEGSRTIVIIAHRLSTFQRADHVVVLEHGRVVETGTPESLAKSGGNFVKLFENELNQV